MNSQPRPLRSTARRWLTTITALALVLGACSDDGAAAPHGSATTASTAATTTTSATTTTTEAPDSRQWPVPQWSVLDDGEAGIDREVLLDLAGRAEQGGSDCLVVTRHGQIVDEWYWNDTGPETEREAFSVTKSITSTLVGIAQDQGHLDIDQPASDFIIEWVGTPSEAVTIRNLLTNDSGRFQNVQSDYVQMAMYESDKTSYAIGLEQQHEIGTVWVYNNAAIQVLEEVLERATGVAVHEYASTELFEPLGMNSTISTDEAGNTLAFMGAQMSCRDMARFGLLFLRGGHWQGEQIVAADWVTSATSPSTDLNPGYGYLWWLVGEGANANVADAVGSLTAQTTPEQGVIPTDGPSAYAALGLGGQVIVVIPEHGLVVTRLGDATTSTFSLLGVLEMLQNDLVTG